jgi:long-chain acyl-CoA synthetase
VRARGAGTSTTDLLVRSLPAMAQKFSTLVDVFDHAVKTFASRPLFGTKRSGTWEWMPYEEFGRQVTRIRAGFAGLGLTRGDCVALIANNRVEWAVAAYAAFGLGVYLVPMYEAQHEKDWDYIVRDCRAKVLIAANPTIVETCKKFLQTIPTLERIVCLDGEVTDGDAVTSWKSLLATTAEVAAIHPAPTDTACIIYTSGTTGNPKGVILSHSNFASNVGAVHEMFPIGADDRSLSFLPWAHSFGQTCELHTLMSVGASTGFAESVDKIIVNLGEVQPTLLFSVPRIFNKIYAGVQKQIAEKPALVQAMVRGALRASAKIRAGESPSFGEGIMLSLANKLVFSKVRAKFGGRLRYAFSGGAAISREVAEFIDSLGITVYEGYGLTETSPIATANAPGARKIGSIGKPIPGVEVLIDGRDGRKTDKGYPEGELVVFGHNVMQGYLNRPEDNAAVFCTRDFQPWGDRAPSPDRGLRTGDIGYDDAEGVVTITGRIKEQYKLENGKYVVPTPLEEAIKLSPYVLNVMVYGDNKPFNVALVVANTHAVREWGEREGLGLPSEPEKMLDDPRVRALFKSELEKHGEKFKGFEAVQDCALIAEDFTAESGLMTPSLKVKRRAVLERYGHLIDALYKRRAQQKKAATAAA